MKIGSTQQSAASDRQVPDSRCQASAARRRFMAGASGAAGVLLAVQAKTALGQVACQSPSAMVSGNQSPRPEEGPCAGGYSPGYWKQPQKFGSWTNAVPPLFEGQTSNYCPDIKGQGQLPPIQDPGTLASEIFSGAPSVSMWLILADPNSYNPNGQLIRHLLCAWLNAGYLGAVYPLSTDQVQDMWFQLSTTGFYYPNGVGAGMTSSDVISYISEMYDLGMASMNGPDICSTEADTTTTTGGDSGSGTTTTTPGGSSGGGKPKKKS